MTALLKAARLCPVVILVLGCGVAAAQATFTTLHSFTNAEGGSPADALTPGSDGNYYGTMFGGGANGTGAIIRVTLVGAVTTIYSFSAANANFENTDGINPNAGLLQGSDGDFYGATFYGGANGTGTLFKVAPDGAFTLLHTFTAIAINTNADGGHPNGLLAEGLDGNFYGMASQGGADGVGTLYQITPAGQFTMLHSFISSEAVFPQGLILGSDGLFYGVANAGADGVTGTVFHATSAGAVTVLHSFRGGASDGSFPLAVLTEASDGNYYGTTQEGGPNGTGTVFKMTPAGTVTILHTFAPFMNGTQVNADGAIPDGALVQATDGNFYGTTYFGGANGTGTIFKITPAGTFTMLYTFSAKTGSFTNADGANPGGGLIEGSDFNLYGMASGGGANAVGTLYRLNVGLTPPPVVAGLRPASTNASGPAFTLFVKGSAFLNTSTVEWTMGGSTTSLATTFVSGVELKADVPAALIVTPGKATITVVTPNAPTSNGKTFTIKVTTIKLVAASLTRDGTTGVITASITLKNAGFLTAPNLSITRSTLGPAGSPVSTTSALPIGLGDLASGATVSTTLTYPGSTGPPGTIAYLKIAGKFAGGKMAVVAKVILP